MPNHLLKPLLLFFDWIILLTLAFFFLLYLSSTHSHALNMSNDNYILQMGTLDSGGGKPTSSTYQLGVSLGQISPGLYSGTNYKVKAGFQYVRTIIPFRFSISSVLIDFGSLSPTTPVTRTNTLTVSNGSAHGYSVTAIEDHPLTYLSNTIPDTTCDAGNCTETTAAAWVNTLTFGFGYRCDNVTGTDCESGFSDSTFYKSFADKSKAKTPQTVMSGLNVGRNKEGQITYKVNISGTQAAGQYTNTLTYIATPTF